MAIINGIEQERQGTRMNVMGVDYTHLRTGDGGDLWVTDMGLPNIDLLLPENWYANKRYASSKKLKGATAPVYRVETLPVGGRSLDLLVRASRVGQDVPLHITESADFIDRRLLDSARWNNPFEEFGRVMELREESAERKERIFTQKPLAIYSPGEVMKKWQTGRTNSAFSMAARATAGGAAGRGQPELNILKMYFLLYGWIKGDSAAELVARGRLSEKESDELTRSLYKKMESLGFLVPDTKPAHIIMRADSEGRLLARGSGPVCAVVDYELLMRTQDAEDRKKHTRRGLYWNLTSRRNLLPNAASFPTNIEKQEIGGIHYMSKRAINGGRIWVPGYEHRLLEFFEPDRWRRTPQVELSLDGRVTMTTTRDNINIVANRSKVGWRPRPEMHHPNAREIIEYGYNDPFEEIAISEALRKHGLDTVYARAVYQSGSESQPGRYDQDYRRFEKNSHLDPVHSVYTLWCFWRGIDPEIYYRSEGHWGSVNISQAVHEGVIGGDEAEDVISDARKQLLRRGIDHLFNPTNDYLLSFNEDGSDLQRGGDGKPVVTISLDAFRAEEYGIITADEMDELVADTLARLMGAGYEDLNMSPKHILVSATPDGVARMRQDGCLKGTLCNFELIRPRNGILRV